MMYQHPRKIGFNNIISRIDAKLILFILYNLAYVFYMLEYIGRSVNLALLLLFVMYNTVDLLHRSRFVLRKSKSVFWNDTKGMLGTFLVFAIISIIIQIYHKDLELSYASYYLYLVLPVVAAFTWANTVESNKMMAYFYVFLGRFILYFLLNNLPNLSLSAISMITFNDSKSSIFESSDAHMFFILMIIFMSQNKKIPAWISGLFCMLSFKRLSFILTPIFLIFYRLLPEGRVNKKAVNICKFIFIISPFIVLFLFNNIKLINSTFGIDLNSFSSERFTLIEYVMKNMKFFNGYGSITDFMTNNPYGDYITVCYMHCDVLQLYWETTIIGVVLYFYNFLNIGKHDYMRFIIVLYFAFEMLTSHFIDVLAAWIILYMFAAMQEKLERDHI